jgi:peptidoglycan hydrolase-like amidase
VGSIKKSDPRLLLMLDRDGSFERVNSQLFLPVFVSAGRDATIRLKVQMPSEGGTKTLTIGDITYTFDVTGRRARSASAEPTRQTFIKTPRTAPTATTTNRVITPAPIPTPAPRVTRTLTPVASAAEYNTPIRIRLGYAYDKVSPKDRATITVSDTARINGHTSDGSPIELRMQPSGCSASQGGTDIDTGVIRIEPTSGGIHTITSWDKPMNRFRGIIECRVLNGEMMLINELPLDDYMLGLSEEPDTEPYEKQRAFAIAARTYALYYMTSSVRKFPGMPFDGSDDPAIFQKYSGYAYEEQHPSWIRAVKSTAKQVLTKDNHVIRPPYFSSDDGKTRSPAEVGWKNFPFAEVFSSKPDPWCEGQALRGHGVGMSGCGAEAQALEGKSAEQILQYYYPGTKIVDQFSL